MWERMNLIIYAAFNWDNNKQQLQNVMQSAKLIGLEENGKQQGNFVSLHEIVFTS